MNIAKINQIILEIDKLIRIIYICTRQNAPDPAFFICLLSDPEISTITPTFRVILTDLVLVDKINNHTAFEINQSSCFNYTCMLEGVSDPFS